MPESRSTAKLHLLPIVAGALALRLIVVVLVAHAHSGGLASWFFGQTTELGRLAESLRTGHGLSSPFGGETGPSAFLAPGYPAIVAVVFALFRPYSTASAIALMCLQTLFGVAAVFVLMRLSQRLFGSSAANIAGTILAISPPALFLPTLFWETSLSILLATTLAQVAIVCAGSPTLRNWMIAGTLAASALAVNPSLLPIIICCFGWSIYITASRPSFAPAAGLLLCVILLTPWTIRNYRELHVFIPFRSNVGYELWQGNRPGADGFFVADLHPNTSSREFQRYESLGEVAYMREKSTIAITAIKENPRRFAALTSKRIFDFWTGLQRDYAALVVAYIVLVSVAGFTGLFLLWRSNKPLAAFFLWPLLVFPIPYYITHPDFRFRLVIDPLLIALSAYAFSARTRQGSGLIRN
jgi:hypothetical protein